MPLNRYTIPLRAPRTASTRTNHDPQACISVEHNPRTHELTVTPLGCAVPMWNYDDFNRYVTALVEARHRIQGERARGWTTAPCKQGCGASVRVLVGFEKNAECAHCAGLEGDDR